MSDTATTTRRSEHLSASPPLLPWPWLDRFTRVHPAVPVLLFGPIIAALVVLAAGRVSFLGLLGLLAGGYLLWTLTEYWLHRIVFHWEPEHPLGQRFHFLIHGVHHEHPNDPKRLVMPPSASIPLAALFLLAFRLVFGADLWLGIGAGFLTGYVIYDSVHYWVHHYRPKSAWGRKLRELHMRHHFQDDTRGYGVSAPWWDVVFRTEPHRRRRAGEAG